MCCAFTGLNKSLTRCPWCSRPRFNDKGKPKKTYQYIPIIPRAQAAYASKASAKRQRYRAEGHKAEPGKMKDYIDGKLYKDMCERRVETGGRKLEFNHFSDVRDIALLLLSDGFRIFKRGQHSAWATMAVNLNLPPERRCHLDETWIICIIPGPNQPKDPDSFHYPLVEELTEAAIGVKTYDACEGCEFLLHIYALLGGGDGPGASKIWLHNKAHNAYSPCRNCEIYGVHLPKPPGGRTIPAMYIPLKPPAGYEREVVDPLNLPLRTHNKWLRQADEVQRAPTDIRQKELSKAYGINGTSIFSQLSSLQFPNSFPVDLMHLLENIMEALVAMWTCQYKGMDSGNEDYAIHETVWSAIGAATAAASSHIPAAFGRRLPNIADDRTYYTAEAWFVWTTLLSPALLHQRFKHPRYYRHLYNWLH